MAAIEQSIPNLLGGVSQQPDPLKLPGQVKRADNVQLDPTFGALKRASTRLIGERITDIDPLAKWIPILRDSEEQYWAVIHKDPIDNTTAKLRVFNQLTAAEIPVQVDPTDGFNYLNIIAEDEVSYEGVSWDDVSHLTIGDYTIIANPYVQPTAYDAGKDGDRRPEGLITVGAAGYGTSYIVDFNREDSDQTQARWSVQELQAPRSVTTKDSNPDDAGEVTINDWFGTGLSFRVKIDARAYLRNDGEEYGHEYIPYVTLLNGGNRADTPFPDQIRVNVNGRGWDIRVSKQTQSTVYALFGTATYTTPVDQSGGGASTSDIVAGLSAAINALGPFTAETVGNVIRVRYTNPIWRDEFTMSARGGTSGDGLDSIKYSVDNLSQLPTECWNGYKVTVRNTEDAEVDDYFVEFQADVADATVPGSGYWTETVKTGDEGGLSDATMPHVLVREGDGTFKFTTLNKSSYGEEWANRSVGSKKTNPNPSFTEQNSGIYGMFMYKNRLGFLTQDAVVMSQVGDYFNFYNTSGVTLSDADPIDMATSDTKPVKLKAAEATTSGAILFGNQAQFRLSAADDKFGPKTAQLDKISNYNYESGARPVQTGVSLVFPTDMGSYSGIYEMSTESIKGSPVIEDSSRVIPRYIPSNLTWSCSNMNNDMIFFGNKTNEVWVFRFFNEGQERKVAGWTKWVFRQPIMNASAYQDKLYLIMREENSNNNWILRINLIDNQDSLITAGEYTYQPRMDKRIDHDNTFYLNKTGGDFREDEYTFTNTYDNFGPAGTENLLTVVYTDTDAGDYDFVNVLGGDLKFRVDKDRPFQVGFTYQMTLDLPNFFVKQDGRADRMSDVMVQGIYFDMYQSSGLSVTIHTNGYDPYQGYLTPIDSDAYNADSAAMRVTGTEFLGLASPGSQTFVTVSSSNPYPSGLTSYSFQGIYNKRGYATLR